jgi:mono/diheme cytochrome c family protein
VCGVPLTRERPHRILGAALLAALCSAAIQPAASSELTQRGEDIAQRLCAACHGIGRTERSPIPVAPAFRRMEPRADLDRMAERLQNGIIVGHPEMPAFVLKEHEARALVAYIRSLRDLN